MPLIGFVKTDRHNNRILHWIYLKRIIWTHGTAFVKIFISGERKSLLIKRVHRNNRIKEENTCLQNLQNLMTVWLQGML